MTFIIYLIMLMVVLWVIAGVFKATANAFESIAKHIKPRKKPNDKNR